MASKMKTPKAEAPPKAGTDRRFRTEVPDGKGGWREATRREECLLLIALEWSMAGVDIPPEALARAAAAYDEAVKPVPAPLLDRAA